MDLSSALLPGLLVFGILAGLARAVTLPSWAKVPIAFVLGIAATVLVANSDFGSSQVVADMPLDQLNGASQVIIGLIVGGTAIGINETFRAVSNVGQNQE